MIIIISNIIIIWEQQQLVQYLQSCMTHANIGAFVQLQPHPSGLLVIIYFRKWPTSLLSMLHFLFSTIITNKIDENEINIGWDSSAITIQVHHRTLLTPLTMMMVMVIKLWRELQLTCAVQHHKWLGHPLIISTLIPSVSQSCCSF